uniref:Programmed cell death protein 2 C-terminal domain-containing protein n=1 Tax=Chlamydomonas leiostraca TaxID=1034604 RepID=A0A7S0RG65_9CHLO|mmetsp:Transcript_21963/g.55935  ORF Transcript_21963/g.55935 Transcript_21963/m.55935 type:complete len:155 (+) Transcript_21963:130-594(+)
MSEYEERVAQEGELSEEELPAEVLEEVAENLTHDRRHFAMFQARVECAPEQCIRYCFQDGAGPLWPSPSNLPSPNDIPACPRCGKARKFEFQVMPQLLNHLGQDEGDRDALDWSTLAVYTCAGSCSLAAAPKVAHAVQGGSTYLEEYVWVQPPS